MQIFIICDRGMIFLRTLLTRGYSTLALTTKLYPENMPRLKTETGYFYDFT
jgi:hypothetical protein